MNISKNQQTSTHIYGNQRTPTKVYEKQQNRGTFMKFIENPYGSLWKQWKSMNINEHIFWDSKKPLRERSLLAQDLQNKLNSLLNSLSNSLCGCVSRYLCVKPIESINQLTGSEAPREGCVLDSIGFTRRYWETHPHRLFNGLYPRVDKLICLANPGLVGYVPAGAF